MFCNCDNHCILAMYSTALAGVASSVLGPIIAGIGCPIMHMLINWFCVHTYVQSSASYCMLHLIHYIHVGILGLCKCPRFRKMNILHIFLLIFHVSFAIFSTEMCICVSPVKILCSKIMHLIVVGIEGWSPKKCPFNSFLVSSCISCMHLQPRQKINLRMYLSYVTSYFCWVNVLCFLSNYYLY